MTPLTHVKLKYVLAIAFAVISICAFSSADTTGLIQYNKAVYSLPVTFDPVQMNDGASLIFSELVYEGLLRLTNDYGYEGSLAEFWTTSTDGKTLTFKIRKNAKFHSGDSVEASDVVASLTRTVAPSSRVFSYYSNIEGSEDYHFGKTKSVSGLRVVDRSTISITLKKAFPPFLYVLAGATAKILPRKNLESNKYMTNPIGSGPFRFLHRQERDGIKKILLERFNQNPRSTGNVDRLSLIETSEESAQSMAAAGQIDDLANWPMTGSEPIFKKGTDISSLVAGTWIIGLNSRMPPFDRVEIRRGFKSSFDSEAFRKHFYPDSERAVGYIPPGFPGSMTSLTEPIRNPKPSVSNAPVTIAVPEGLANGEQIVSFLEQAFHAKGWNVKALIMPWAKMMKAYEDKTLQAFLLNMNVDYPDSEFLLRNFRSDNTDNFSGMRDLKFDAILDNARSTVDRLARESLYKEAAARVDAFSPSINLFYPRAHAWISNCVRGFEPNLLSDVYIDYAKVSLDVSCIGSRGSP